MTLVSAIAFANPAGAAAADITRGYGAGTPAARTVLAQADATQAIPAQERPQHAQTKQPHARPTTIRDVDEWIGYLHDQLHVTPAQTAQWNAVAQVMRENEQSVHRLIEERQRNRQTMNAVDDLRSYEQLTEAHVDGIKRLVPVFETFYASMSDDQKKTADTVFASLERHRAQNRRSS